MCTIYMCHVIQQVVSVYYIHVSYSIEVLSVYYIHMSCSTEVLSVYYIHVSCYTASC